MVEVNDKVFVAPLYGQPDNTAVITGPAGAGAVLNEGDYNTWTKGWINAPSNGFGSYDATDILIDERNDTLSIVWWDSSADIRFGVYNINDLSPIYESPLGSDYVYEYPNNNYKKALTLGMTNFYQGGVSQSIQTYLLLMRADHITVEVWRSGSSLLWTTNVQTDYGAHTIQCYIGGISLTGKYVLVIVEEQPHPYDTYLILYKGSSV